ncbi:MAG: methionine--tRNA ligase [Parcubacteria group bacterium]|nr:methionine--tRNA ligase [Parcubacteria group bacterium]
MLEKNIFIGAAWPYADGSLHLGRIAGLLAGDVLARFHRLRGDRVLYVSGSDCHGTPITVCAEKENKNPADIAEFYHQEFSRTFQQLDFSYDVYTKTTTDNHKTVAQDMFLQLYKKGYIYVKNQTLPYCEKCAAFRADRYIEGICPKCGYEDARGDQCDKCGAILNALDLKNPRCKICKNAPIPKETEHFFLKLSAFEKQLTGWIQSKNWKSNAKNMSLNFIKEGLKDRAVTRDLSWGVAIPLPQYEQKKLYVWFEAVIGYLSASIEYSKKIGDENYWKGFWQNDNAFHYYVHGKDNIPFHTIIWPTMLMGKGDLHLPDQIVSSEYLNLENQKFSSSRNWAVWAPEFLEEFPADYLRYYLVRIYPDTADSNFSWKEFGDLINNELIAAWGNFVNRTVSIAHVHFNGIITRQKKIENTIIGQKEFDDIATLIGYDPKIKNALAEIFKIVHRANQYIDKEKPWEAVKTDKAHAEATLYICLETIFNCAILSEPFMPSSSTKIFDYFGIKDTKWEYSYLPEKISLGIFSPLFEKITPEKIEKQIEKLKTL